MSEQDEQIIARKSGFLVLVVIIITVGFALILPEIKIEMDFNRFLPDHEVVTAYDDMEEYFGKENEYFYILIEGANENDNILTPRALREQYNVSLELMNCEGVLDVYGIAPIVNDRLMEEFSRSLLNTSDSAIYLMIDIIQWLLTSENNTGNYTQKEFEAAAGILLSKDFDMFSEPLKARSTVMVVVLDPNLSNAELKELSVKLKDELEYLKLSQLELGYTGNHLITNDIDRIGNQNVIILGIAIVLLVTIVLAFTFRKLSYVLLPLGTLAIAIIWTFGSMALLGIRFTIIDIAVVPLLLGLGVDYTVHMSRRYLYERDRADSISTALNRTQRFIVPAIFLAVLTTTIAFLSNQMSSIEPVQEFGLICAMGIVYAFILTLIFHNTGRF